jgi:hypothetical protein
MATLKLTLDKRRKYQDGRSPVVIRLTSDGKSTCIPTAVKLDSSQWDNQRCKVNRKHANQKELNLHLQGNLVEFEEKLMLMESNPMISTGVSELKRLLTVDSKPVKTLLTEFGQDHIEHLQAQERFGNAQSFITAINRLTEFAGSKMYVTHGFNNFFNCFDANVKPPSSPSMKCKLPSFESTLQVMTARLDQCEPTVK